MKKFELTANSKMHLGKNSFRLKHLLALATWKRATLVDLSKKRTT